MEKIFEEEFRRRREVTNELNGFGYEKKYEDIYNEFFKEKLTENLQKSS